MIRLVNVNKIWLFLDEHFQCSYKYSTVTVLGKLFVMIIWLGHISCCGFIAIGKLSINEGQ